MEVGWFVLKIPPWSKTWYPGMEGSNPNELKVHDGVLYFSAFTPAAGFEVWSSDGSAENTLMLVDVLPGPEYSNASKFAKLDDYLVFYALTPETGMQLWSYKFNNVTAVEELTDNLSIYPNPSNGLFQLKRGTADQVIVEIFSLDGRSIGKMNYNDADDMHGYPDSSRLVCMLLRFSRAAKGALSERLISFSLVFFSALAIKKLPDFYIRRYSIGHLDALIHY